MLVTLNGGVWADASCRRPEWDVNDWLEQDAANCQWNEKNEVMPDDFLRHLPGSIAAPELARSLTFNVYAKAVRHYKKRNLQQAARHIVDFVREHPDLFVGVNARSRHLSQSVLRGKTVVRLQPGHARAVPGLARRHRPVRGRGRRRARSSPLSAAHAAGRWRTCGGSRASISPTGKRSIRRVSFRAIRRIPSGWTPGCANGKSSGVISSSCITTISRSGSSKPAFRATRYGRRRDSWRRHPARCRSPFRSTVRSRTSTRAA